MNVWRMKALLRCMTISVATTACLLVTSPSWADAFFDFDVASEFTDNFSLQAGDFSYSSGPGADGVAGRVSLSGISASNSTAGVVYAPGGVFETFENITYSVDFKFNDQVLHAGDSSNKQFFGLAFNAGADRNGMVLQIRNVDHVGDTSDPDDVWRLRKSGDGSLLSWGSTVLHEQTFANPVPIRPEANSNDWLRLVLHLENSSNDQYLSVNATLYDLLNDSIIDTFSYNNLEYAADLAGVATAGGIGVLGSNNADSKTSVKWDNFSITANAIPEPGTIALLLTGLGSLFVWRKR